MEIKVERNFLKFEALTGLPKAGPVYKIPSIFSSGGIPGNLLWGYTVRLSKSRPLLQTDAYKANVRECPPPGIFSVKKMNTINY